MTLAEVFGVAIAREIWNFTFCLSCLENDSIGEYICNECVSELFPFNHIVDDKQLQDACQNYSTQCNAVGNTTMHEGVHSLNNKSTTLKMMSHMIKIFHQISTLP